MLARARAEILAPALRHNLRALAAHAGARVLLPVKANAYGHGLGLVVRAVGDLPEVWGYAVAMPQEAAELAALGTGKPTVLLTPAAPEEYAELADLGVRLPVMTLQEARTLPGHARAHLKVDTGMNRLGARPEAAHELAELLAARGLLEGVYTHFAGADDQDLGGARAQLAAFKKLLATLPPALSHISNSGGVLSFGREAGLDLIRPGLAAYGYPPEHLTGVLPLRPALRLRARVGYVHAGRAGEPVSYSGLATLTRDTDIATVQFGYADGYPRNATLKAQVRVAGQLRPVLGRICMDQFMLDVTGLDVRAGDWVEVFGDGPITGREVAAWGDTVPYELLCGIGNRVERVLVEDEKAAGVAREADLASR